MSKLLKNESTSFNFRLADQNDINDIVALVELAYRGEKSKQGWTTEAEFIDGQRTDFDEVSQLMQKTDSVFILCYQQQELVASVQISKSTDYCYLGMFAVNPQRQSSGIGGLLLEQAEHHARQQWTCHLMRMVVISIRQELIDWYRRKGYQPTGKTKPFPYHEPRFGLPKRDDLTLEIYEKKLNEKVNEEKTG